MSVDIERGRAGLEARLQAAGATEEEAGEYVYGASAWGRIRRAREKLRATAAGEGDEPRAGEGVKAVRVLDRPEPAPTMAAQVEDRARRLGGVIDAALPDPVLAASRRAPTPGGLFPLVLVILIMIVAIVPMNAHGKLAGNSRLLLLFKALTGGAEMPCTDQGLARKKAEQDAVTQQQTAAAVAAGLSGSGIGADFQAIQSAAGSLAGSLWTLHPLGTGGG